MTSGLRWREDTGYEWRCGACRSSWPLDDPLSWPPARGLDRCAACRSEGRPASRHMPRLRREGGRYVFVCGACRKALPVEGGYYRGRYAACRACTLDGQRKWRLTHPDSPERKAAKAELAALYRRTQPGVVAAYNRAWRERNREAVLRWQRDAYAKNREHARALGRANYRRHAEAYRRAAREHYAAMTPEQREHRRAVSRANYAKRRAAA